MRSRWSSLEVILIHSVRYLSSGWGLLNSNSGPNLQFHVSPPPQMLFGGYLPRHLYTSCIHECVWPPWTGSLACRASGSSTYFRTESSDPEPFRVHSFTSNLRNVVGNFHRCRRCQHPDIWTWSHRYSGYSIVLFHKIPSRPSSFGRFTSAPLLSRSFSANWSAPKQTIFGNHKAHARRCTSSPPATTDPSVRQLGCSHFVIGDQREHRFTKHAQRWYIRRSAQILELCSAVGSHCESWEQIQRNKSQMEWQVKLLKAVCQWSSRFVSGGILRVLNVSVYHLAKPVALMTFGANRNTFLLASMILISLSHWTITGLRKPQSSKCLKISFVKSS